MIKMLSDVMLISIFWFIAIYSFKMKNLDKIALRKGDSKLEKYIVFISKILIGLVISVDTALILNKNSIIFSLIDTIFGASFFSHIIYLACLVVLFTVTTQMTSKALESERYMLKAQKKAIAFMNGLIVIGLTLVLFYIQSVFWGAFSYIYSEQRIVNREVEAIIDGILILIPAFILITNGIRYLTREKIRTLGFRISIPLIMFISFGQMLIVKIIVFCDCLVWFLKKLKIKKIAFDDYIGDYLLIASSLSFGKKFAKINAYFLTSYFVVMLLVWTPQLNPVTLMNDLYANGYSMALFFSVAIILFGIIEGVSRSQIKYGKYIRLFFIPVFLILTIYPFYTDYAHLNSFIKITDIKSIYHVMANALGKNKYLFFLCAGVIQAVVAYIMHVITGEAHNDRHYYSVLPIIFIVQIMILVIMYPVFISIPPYTIQENKILIISLIIVLGVMITLFIGNTSFQYFTSKDYGWASYVSDYWKDKQRVFIIISLITLLCFLPILSIGIFPIHNKNITFVWNHDYIDGNDNFKAQTLIQTYDTSKTYLLSNNGNNSTKLNAISIVDGSPLWDKTYSANYDRYKLWDDQNLVIVKAQNIGFSVINLENGEMIYDYTVEEPGILEFLNIEINDRTVLLTVDTEQFIFDKKYGQMQLDTLGNNFYHLIQGNYCALSKNSKVYVYQNERWEKISGIASVETAELIYYDENGMLVFTDQEIIKYNPELTQRDTVTYTKDKQHLIQIERNYYTKKGNEVTFFFLEGVKTYAYVFNIQDFTYKVIDLQQKIKGYADFQKIKVCNNEGVYFLYDQYQFTLFKNENLIARQWYHLPLNKEDKDSNEMSAISEPILLDDKIIWAQADGDVHCVGIK